MFETGAGFMDLPADLYGDYTHWIDGYDDVDSSDIVQKNLEAGRNYAECLDNTFAYLFSNQQDPDTLSADYQKYQHDLGYSHEFQERPKGFAEAFKGFEAASVDNSSCKYQSMLSPSSINSFSRLLQQESQHGHCFDYENEQCPPQKHYERQPLKLPEREGYGMAFAHPHDNIAREEVNSPSITKDTEKKSYPLEFPQSLEQVNYHCPQTEGNPSWDIDSSLYHHFGSHSELAHSNVMVNTSLTSNQGIHGNPSHYGRKFKATMNEESASNNSESCSFPTMQASIPDLGSESSSGYISNVSTTGTNYQYSEETISDFLYNNLEEGKEANEQNIYSPLVSAHVGGEEFSSDSPHQMINRGNSFSGEFLQNVNPLDNSNAPRYLLVQLPNMFINGGAYSQVNPFFVSGYPLSLETHVNYNWHNMSPYSVDGSSSDESNHEKSNQFLGSTHFKSLEEKAASSDMGKLNRHFFFNQSHQFGNPWDNADASALKRGWNSIYEPYQCSVLSNQTLRPPGQHEAMSSNLGSTNKTNPSILGNIGAGHKKRDSPFFSQQDKYLKRSQSTMCTKKRSRSSRASAKGQFDPAYSVPHSQLASLRGPSTVETGLDAHQSSLLQDNYMSDSSNQSNTYFPGSKFGYVDQGEKHGNTQIMRTVISDKNCISLHDNTWDDIAGFHTSQLYNGGSIIDNESCENKKQYYNELDFTMAFTQTTPDGNMMSGSGKPKGKGAGNGGADSSSTSRFGGKTVLKSDNFSERMGRPSHWHPNVSFDATFRFPISIAGQHLSNMVKSRKNVPCRKA